MHPPDFWQRGKGGAASLVLAPFGWLYGAVSAIRIATATPWKSPVPVICIGNLVAGGAGKTPVALDFGKKLLDQGRAVHFVSRGYGGTERGPLRVDPDRHTSQTVGDEPLLLARLAPTWIAADRKQGCQAAADSGADIISGTQRWPQGLPTGGRERFDRSYRNRVARTEKGRLFGRPWQSE